MSQGDTDEQQLHLRWNNHTNNLVDIFREQFCKQNLVDVTLSCQGKHFKAHRMVLSACSPYFQDLFDSHDTPHPIIILNNMNQVHVKNLLEFMYKGEIKVLESELECFLQIAEVLQVKGLCNIRTKETKRQSTVDDEEPRRKFPKMCDEGTSQTTVGDDSSDRLDIADNDDSFEAESPSTVVKRESKVPPVVRVQVGDSSSPDKGDNDLASLIKVEPPDIRDIDGSSFDDAEGPRVIIDLPVVTDDNLTTITTTTIRSPKNANQNEMDQKLRTKSFPKVGRPRKDRGELCDEVAKIRRPPNAFMIFANEWRRKLASENPTESNKAISIRLGVMWKSMDATEKESYYNAAKQADLEHKQKYPGYYYSPKEAREALLRKKLTKKKSCFEATQLVRVLMPVGDEDQDDLDDQVAYS